MSAQNSAPRPAPLRIRLGSQEELGKDYNWRPIKEEIPQLECGSTKYPQYNALWTSIEGNPNRLQCKLDNGEQRSHSTTVLVLEGLWTLILNRSMQSDMVISFAWILGLGTKAERSLTA
ncbi:Hypothetical predicted protein [Lecanosticta acicola]|uniref:Uncharacterized protein n=1 Tax=Lecanosticta acicola TaxID=111012 RepID=A0AAI9ECN5_9PEZI|nr:Hypothetical predicted protein [Lecanosticta acicola]